jgi:hypothetical protein
MFKNKHKTLLLATAAIALMVQPTFAAGNSSLLKQEDMLASGFRKIQWRLCC